MDISKYATAATVKTAAAKVPSQLVAFCLFLAENNTRITYKAIDTIKAGRVRAGMPHYADVLNAIPAQLQWVVCNSAGKYAGKPLETWGSVAPEGFMGFPFIQPEQAVEAYAEWCSEAQAAE